MFTDQPPIVLRWQRRIGKIAPFLLGVILLAPLFIYCITIFRNAYNFPYEDDFNSALSFVSDFAFKHTLFSDRIQLLFAQYNEHRIVFDRLVFLGDYYFFGALNFRYLILLGNTAVLILAFLFVKLSFRTYSWPQRLLYLVPVSYALFLFQYWELTTWAMAALSNFYTVVFALFSFYQLSKPGKYAFSVACASASMATFTLGSGLISFIAGVPILLLLKNYRRLGIWLVIGAVNILFYFKGYYRPPYHPSITNTLFNHTGQAIHYFFSLLGTFFPGRPTVSLLFGILLFLSAVILIVFRWLTHRLSENLPLLGLFLFVYLTCLSITMGRAGFGIQQAYSTRYGFIVVTLYASQAILTIETIKNLYWRTATALFLGCLSMFLFVSNANRQNRRSLERRASQLHELVLQYQKNPNTVKLPWGDAKEAKAIFDDAVAKGIFQMPEKINQ